MQGKERSNFGETEAQRIHRAGWRQGSIFRPPEKFDVPVPFDRSREVLVVCTQSCTVVSPNFDANPLIEYLVAKPVEKYHPRSNEAKGKNSHCFHLPVPGMTNAEALGCDINRRFFVDRKVCVEHAPEERLVPSEEGVRNLAGWIARYYTRIALPDELVTRAKVKNGLFEIIQKALRTKNSSGYEMSTTIDRIGVNWTPDSDMHGGFYDVQILFLCTDADADAQLNSLLVDPLSPFTDDNGHDGIKLVYDTTVRSSTFISAFDGYKRLTEWDYLSNPGDVAESEN
jgi:hypothetical protein